jgi:decaprenylphospho-beta-D-ribofuranose 2-oxidase
MPQAEAQATLAAERTAVTPAVVAGWGGGPGAALSIVRPDGVESVRACIELAANGAIARGMGCSYGDAAQLSGGLAIDSTLLKRMELDPEAGTVTAQAGVTIGELLDALVPLGWMVPVVPGTQHVSVGGAIASDIHGKNHATAGTFGSHVEALSLLRADGELRELAPGSPDGLFEATVGGMGLTGVIVTARIRLRPVNGALLAVDTDQVGSLDDALAALREPGGPYRVAWLDLLCSRPGRGIVTRAEHVDSPRAEHVDSPRSEHVDSPRSEHVDSPGAGAHPTVQARAAVPRWWPAGALRPSTIRAFNALRYASAPRRERARPESIGRHMFPLDALSAWPRLYGPRGLLQYQLAVPSGSEKVLELAIERLRAARVPCYLAVLKDFGPANGAPLSFPIRGWTLALDMPRAAPGLEPLLDGLDELVAEAGGRVYLSKDARLRPEAVQAMYPQLDQWRRVREQADPEGLWRSDLAVRTGLV